jgi:hypothetical protein
MSRSAARASQQHDQSANADASLASLRRMMLIRGFELEMQRLFLRGEVHGTTHLYNGQEAVSVGVCSVLRPGDYVSATYRGHGAALAMGIPAEALAAELMGRTTGVDGGRGGSMNVIDLERGLVGRDLREARWRGVSCVLRRWCRESGVFPRMPELRGDTPSPCCVRLREQPVRRVHRHGLRHRRW